MTSKAPSLRLDASSRAGSYASEKMAPPSPKRSATYADLEAVPPGQLAEIIDGTLHVFPRPAPKHLSAADQLSDVLRPPFHHRRGGPGGWIILHEPEVHFPRSVNGRNVVDPDLAGWHRDRMPTLPDTAYFTLRPDWICEVLSPSTEKCDRTEKLPLYETNGVPHVWLLDPVAQTLEVYVLNKRKWRRPAARHIGEARIHVPPFEDIELDLSVLWQV